MLGGAIDFPSLEEIWEHRALDTNTSTKKRSPPDGVSMGSSVSLFVRAFESLSSESVVIKVVPRPIDSYRYLLFFSFILGLSLLAFSGVFLRTIIFVRVKMHTNENDEKAYLGDGAVLELAGDSRELRELGGLRREMRVRMSVERSDRCLSRTTRSRTILRE